ncbi:hypothetical protein D3C80_1727300 [compost metagenome]
MISDPSANKEKIEKYLNHIETHKVNTNIQIQLGSVDFYNLLRHADLSIRATNTDGDALSIRESIHLNKPCAASDAVKRPSGVIIFRSRSAEGLKEAILDILNKKSYHAPPEAPRDETTSFYNELY